MFVRGMHACWQRADYFLGHQNKETFSLGKTNRTQYNRGIVFAIRFRNYHRLTRPCVDVFKFRTCYLDVRGRFCGGNWKQILDFHALTQLTAAHTSTNHTSTWSTLKFTIPVNRYLLQFSSDDIKLQRLM
jgi:hypothetical protein